jgi:hypothetical protein
VTDRLSPPHLRRRPGCRTGRIAALDLRGDRQVFLIASAAPSTDRFEPPRRHVSPPIRTPNHGALAMRSLLTILLLLTASVALAQPQSLAGPPGSERFGAAVRWLPNGNLVVVDPDFDREDGTVNVGAVWIYRPDGSLLSRLTGAADSDILGNTETVGALGVQIVGGSNFVVRSSRFANDAGSRLTGMVAGRNAFICSQCVDDCQALLRASLPGS